MAWWARTGLARRARTWAPLGLPPQSLEQRTSLYLGLVVTTTDQQAILGSRPPKRPVFVWASPRLDGWSKRFGDFGYSRRGSTSRSLEAIGLINRVENRAFDDDTPRPECNMNSVATVNSHPLWCNHMSMGADRPVIIARPTPKREN